MTSDGATSFVYDADNRLVSASGTKSATLSYDPLGRLFQTSGGTAGTTQFLYDGDRLVAEYDGSGNLVRRYVHGTGVDEPVLWYEGSSLASRRGLFADHQGSIIAVTDESGSAFAINGYDAWGVPNPDNNGRFQYTGQAWIPELGLYYYKARVYAPALGRFLQTDPIGYDDDLNLYAYVKSDPLNQTDPTGNCPQCFKAVIDFGLELAVQYAMTGEIDLAEAALETAKGMIDPTRSLKKITKLGKVAKKYYTRAQREKRFKEVDGKCEYCGKKTQMEKPFQKDSAEGDHGTAQSRGGRRRQRI